MTAPDESRLIAAMHATWPAAAIRRLGPWTLREGQGGGRRVSAATAQGPVTEGDVAAAEAAMRAMGQRPIFSVPDGDAALSSGLRSLGFTECLPVDLWSAPVGVLAARDLPRVAAFAIWQPLAIIDEIWEANGVGAARRAIMARVDVPKTAILTRAESKPAGAAFAACDGEVAMIHAIVTRPERRRRGAARHAIVCAARWAGDHGAHHVTLAVTPDNAPAAALYSGLGMRRVGGYHYLSRPEAPE